MRAVPGSTPSPGSPPPVAPGTPRASDPPMPPPAFGRSARGPEDVVIDADGHLYTGLGDGRILRSPRGGPPTVVADTGGRPLGVEVDADGGLVVCDA